MIITGKGASSFKREKKKRRKKLGRELQNAAISDEKKSLATSTLYEGGQAGKTRIGGKWYWFIIITSFIGAIAYVIAF